MVLVGERPHKTHGSSVFNRDGLKVNNIPVCEEENVELITGKLHGVVVHSIYKQPPELSRLPKLANKPHIVIGDFNNHITLWEKHPLVVPQQATSRRRVSLKKANWDGFLTEVDAAIK